MFFSLLGTYAFAWTIVELLSIEPLVTDLWKLFALPLDGTIARCIYLIYQIIGYVVLLSIAYWVQ